MERRDFFRLIAGAIVVLPVGSFLITACGSSESDESNVTTPNGDNPAAPPEASGSQVIYSTNVIMSDEGPHFHEVTIDAAAFTTPPSGGVSMSTSVEDNHSHTFTASMEQLAKVGTGQTVKITTGSAEGHTHVVTLVKLS